MNRSYEIRGMSCGKCVSKVKSELLKMPEVLGAEVQLQSPQAVVEMQSPIALSKLERALREAGDYSIEERRLPDAEATAIAPTTFFQTYKPLFLIVIFIAGVSLLSATGSENYGMTVMRFFMAGFFLVFSFFKLLDLRGFKNSYAMYDLLAQRWPGYGYLYPFLELLLGVAYLLNFAPLLTNSFTILLLGFSSLGVIRSVLSKSQIQCACLGSVFNLPMSTVTIIEDVSMVLMAGVMLWMHG